MVQCESNLATQFTLTVLSIPYQKRLGEVRWPTAETNALLISYEGFRSISDKVQVSVEALFLPYLLYHSHRHSAW
jgi:hypothetical protein